MTWNYRICREVFTTGNGKEEYYSIKEVYYDEEGKVKYYTENPAGIGGYTVEEIISSLEKIKLALDKDIVDIPAGNLTEGN